MKHSPGPVHPYAPTQGNGVTSTKRMREDDGYKSRPASRSEDLDSLKRRKLGTECGRTHVPMKPATAQSAAHLRAIITEKRGSQ